MPNIPVLAAADGALAQAADAVCGDPAAPVCTWVLQRTDSEFLATAARAIVPHALTIALIIAIAYIANRLIRRAIDRFVNNLGHSGLRRLGPRRANHDREAPPGVEVTRTTMRAQTIASVLRSIATFTIWTIALVMVLAEFTVELGPLIASAGVAGVALGFGAQSLVKDFLSGMFMLMEDQYGIGDVVDTGMDGPNGFVTGTIEGITLRTTRLRDVYGTVWYVPNGEIRRVGNFSQQWARALLDIGVAYDTDLKHAFDVIKRVADSVWQDAEWQGAIQEEPELWGVQDFGPDQVTIRLVLKVNPSMQWPVNREVRRRLKEAFDSEGIEIPFPQRMVWMRNADGASSGNTDDASSGTEPDRARNATETAEKLP